MKYDLHATTSTPIKLAGGFGVILSSLLAISIMGIVLVSQLIRAQDAIVSEYNVKKDISEKMLSFAQRRFLVIARMLNKDDVFDIEDLKMERMEYGGHFVYHLVRLQKMKLNSEEEELIKEIRASALHSSNTVDSLIKDIENQNQSLMKRFDNEALPSQEKVYVALNKFSKLQETYSKKIALESQQMRDSYLVLQISVTVLLLCLGSYLAFFVTRKIMKTEDQLSIERKQAITTLSSISDTVISTSHDSKIQFINPAGEKLFGIDMQLSIGRTIDEVIPLHAGDNIICLECIFGGSCQSQDCPKGKFDPCYTNKDGKKLILEIERNAIYDDIWNRFLGYVIVMRDVTEKRRSERLLEKQAKSDNLTHLANRASLDEALQTVMSEDGIKTNLLCYMDLDRFKIINDTCGHTAGDELLKQVAKILQKNGRKSDVLARIGGDEFVIIMRDCDLAAGIRYSESIISDIGSYKLVWEDKDFSIGVSIGIVTLNPNTMTAESALKAADHACYQAKAMGRNRFCIYDPGDSVIAKHTSEVEWCNNISRALKEDGFILYGQTIVALDSQNEKMIEVLLRYDDQEKLWEAKEFIPAAERYNLCSDIDYWVMDSVFEKLKLGVDELTVFSINVSSQSISNNYFRNYILQQIDALGINATNLCFEIGEATAVANIIDVTEFIQELKSKGCKFAISDFGNGVSSFSYLQALPVDYIKINGEIIKELVDSHVHYHMAESIHNIAHLMQIQTIAEYVTNKEIMKSVEKIGIDFAQGYHMAKPQLLEELLLNETIERAKA